MEKKEEIHQSRISSKVRGGFLRIVLVERMN